MEYAGVFSNRYCVYVLMEQFYVVNKTETKGVSTDIMREGLRRLLLRHKQGLDVSELVTDASFVVQKLVKDLKAINPLIYSVMH